MEPPRDQVRHRCDAGEEQAGRRRRCDRVLGQRVRQSVSSGDGVHARAAMRRHITHIASTATPGRRQRRETTDVPTQPRTSSASAAPSRPCRPVIPTPRPHIHLPPPSIRISTLKEGRRTPARREMLSCKKFAERAARAAGVSSGPRHPLPPRQCNDTYLFYG